MTDTSPSAPSPAERRRLKVRSAILDAAERVFAVEGTEGLSIRRLAEEIDYSPAAIYKYFGSKDELVEELKEAFFGRIMEQVDAAQGSTEPFTDRARACLSVYIETALEKPQHYMAAFSSVPGEMDDCHRAPMVEIAQTNKMQAFTFLVGMVAEGQACRVLRNDISEVALAMSFWSGCHGAAMLIAHLPGFPETIPVPSGETRQSFVAAHVDMMIEGAAPR